MRVVGVEFRLGPEQKRLGLDRFQDDLRDARRIAVRRVAKQQSAFGKRFAQNLPVLVGHLNARKIIHRQLRGQSLRIGGRFDLDRNRRDQAVGQRHRHPRRALRPITVCHRAILLFHFRRRAHALIKSSLLETPGRIARYAIGSIGVFSWAGISLVADLWLRASSGSSSDSSAGTGVMTRSGSASSLSAAGTSAASDSV